MSAGGPLQRMWVGPLQGKLNGLAVRVPLTNSSLTDCVFEVQRPTTVEEVNRLLKEASETYLKGVLGYEDRPLVSTDYVNDARSSIVDGPCTQVHTRKHDLEQWIAKQLSLKDLKVRKSSTLPCRPAYLSNAFLSVFSWSCLLELT